MPIRRRRSANPGMSKLSHHLNGLRRALVALPCTTIQQNGRSMRSSAARGAGRQACHVGGPADRSRRKTKAIHRHDCRRGKQDCSMPLSLGPGQAVQPGLAARQFHARVRSDVAWALLPAAPAIVPVTAAGHREESRCGKQECSRHTTEAAALRKTKWH